MAGIEQTRYDNLSIALHWATAILVLVQFVTSLVWGLFPQAERHLLIVAHMSFGIILAGVILVRLGWRLTPGHRVAPAVSGWVEHASKAVHRLLYAMLVGQACLGFLLRWSGGEAMSLFGLPIPSPMAESVRPAHHLIGELHEWLGWSLIALAAGHALAALYHHYIAGDDVLSRMLPR